MKMSAKQTADYLRVSTWHFYYSLRKGEYKDLPRKKIRVTGLRKGCGKQWQIDKDELMEYLLRKFN